MRHTIAIQGVPGQGAGGGGLDMGGRETEEGQTEKTAPGVPEPPPDGLHPGDGGSGSVGMAAGDALGGVGPPADGGVAEAEAAHAEMQAERGPELKMVVDDEDAEDWAAAPDVHKGSPE